MSNGLHCDVSVCVLIKKIIFVTEQQNILLLLEKLSIIK